MSRNSMKTEHMRKRKRKGEKMEWVLLFSIPVGFGLFLGWKLFGWLEGIGANDDEKGAGEKGT